MTGRPQPAQERGPWWARPGLECVNGRLHVAGRDAGGLARRCGTPLFVFDLERCREALRSIRSALLRAGLRPRVRVALKAQRDPAFLRAVRSLGEPGTDEAIGVDACSPGEVGHALANGFLPEEISLTGTNLSERDWSDVLAHPLHVNVDLLSQMERVGRLAPGRSIGIRLNPRAGAVNPGTGGSKTIYSGDRPTKFGIYDEDLAAACALARRHDLTIDTVHFHVANGVLDEDLPAYDRAVAAMVPMIEELIESGCPIAEINVGGGLGDSTHPWERPLDLDAWAAILRDRLGGLDAVVACEPGEFVTMASGVLLAEVVTVERRLGHLFAGLDVGWNVLNHRFVYNESKEVVHCASADGRPADEITFAGNINEGADLFAEDVPFPPVAEGDVVAILAAGAYSMTNYHAHCLRPPAAAVFFDDRLPAD